MDYAAFLQISKGVQGYKTGIKFSAGGGSVKFTPADMKAGNALMAALSASQASQITRLPKCVEFQRAAARVNKLKANLYAKCQMVYADETWIVWEPQKDQFLKGVYEELKPQVEQERDKLLEAHENLKVAFEDSVRILLAGAYYDHLCADLSPDDRKALNDKAMAAGASLPTEIHLWVISHGGALETLEAQVQQALGLFPTPEYIRSSFEIEVLPLEPIRVDPARVALMSEYEKKAYEDSISAMQTKLASSLSVQLDKLVEETQEFMNSTKQKRPTSAEAKCKKLTELLVQAENVENLLGADLLTVKQQAATIRQELWELFGFDEDDQFVSLATASELESIEDVESLAIEVHLPEHPVTQPNIEEEEELLDDGMPDWEAWDADQVGEIYDEPFMDEEFTEDDAWATADF